MKCFIHKYKKWSLCFNATVVRGYGGFGDTKNVDVVMQERICEKCGYVDSRHVRDGYVQDLDHRGQGR
jgi:hypothetical protein